MLTESITVKHIDREDLGYGKIVGIDKIVSSEPMLDSEGKPVLNAEGNMIMSEKIIPYMIVVWSEITTPAVSYHTADELEHLFTLEDILDMDLSSDDDDDEDEVDEVEDIEVKAEVIPTQDEVSNEVTDSVV